MSHETTPQDRRLTVLLIGAAGLVGQMIIPAMQHDYDLVLADRAGDNLVHLDVTDHRTIHDAVRDIDIVIFCAMGSKDGWGTLGGWAEGHFDVSVKGLYLTLQAAAAAGVGKLVYASSLSIFRDYLHHGQALEERTPDAIDGYGLTKRLGEQVCSAAAAEHGLHVVSLRLCGPLPDNEWRAHRGARPEIMTAATDVGTAFAAAAAHHGTGHETFIITGDHDHQFIAHRRTRDILGWQPMMRRTP